jgi:TonB family protein
MVRQGRSRGYIAAMQALSATARRLDGHAMRPRSRRVIAGAVLATLATAATACIDRDTAQKAIESVQESAGVRPDSMPVMLNESSPFQYPESLYAKHIQANVTLRIRIDSTGMVTPESTIVQETSGYPALDSAAVHGSQSLRFKPATLHGQPLSISILLPVFFRRPGEPPLPGDTVLHDTAHSAKHRTP